MDGIKPVITSLFLLTMLGALVRAQDVVLPGSTVQGDSLPGQGQFLEGMA